MTPLVEFPERLEWLNVGERPRLAALRGRAVALLFVNLGSQWSLAAARQLAQAQARQRGRLQALAVHVPRFEYERDAARMLTLAHRERFPLPLAHDRDWVLWQHHGITAWPSLLLADASGAIRGTLVGELNARELLDAVNAACETVPGDPDELPGLRPRINGEPPRPLCFPAGVVATDNAIYVADSGHHRVLECDLGGRIRRQYGCGDPGALDGDAESASLCDPAGLTLHHGTLFVADRGNDCVRRIDVRSGQITTLDARADGDRPLSPQAIVASGEQLLVTAARDNRVWRYDLQSGQGKIIAGSGQLGVHDGVGAEAAFAQPTGLAAREQRIYVCDAAGSAVRVLNARTMRVDTVLGQGPWTFGNADGRRADARLQAPAALALDPENPLLWIADTGNDCLRTLKLGGDEVATVPLSQSLHSPEAMAFGAGALWLADRDAHRILRIAPATGDVSVVPVGE
jgi:sugar lactone lactonase YvrE